MRVLHVAACMSPEWGGPVPVVEALAEEQTRLGLEVQVLATTLARVAPASSAGAPGAYQTRLFPQDVLARVWTAHSAPLAKEIRRAVREADIVHVHETWHHPHAVACAAARRYGRPWIVTPHGALDSWSLAHRSIRKALFAALAERRYLQHAAAVHALTSAEEKAIRSFGVTSPVVVIPNGIDVARFEHLPSRRQFEEACPELRGKTVILFLARLHSQKGLDILVRAFGMVSSLWPTAHLVIAGPDSGGYRATIEESIRASGIEDRVTLTGMLVGDLKLAALSRADVFALTSRSEGFSMSILEAMACRLPVLITHQCYFPEVAAAGAGLVVDPRESEVASSLAVLLGDPDLRQEMGRRGLSLVGSRYTWQHCAEEVVRMYSRALDRTGAP